MTALTDQRTVDLVGGYPIPDKAVDRPIRNGVTLYKGGMAAADVAGRLVPAGNANAVTQVLGALLETPGCVASLTGDAAGSVRGRLSQRICWYANSGGADAITLANLYEVCYAADDQTVALSDGNGTRLPAGIIADVDATKGVAVQIVPAIPLTMPMGIKRVAATITGNGGGGDAELTAAGLTQTVNIGSPLPQTAIVIGSRAMLDDAFDNGAGVSLAMEIGHNGAQDAYEEGFDCYTASAHEGGSWEYTSAGAYFNVPPAKTPAGTRQVIATFTAGGDQLVNFTGGIVHVEVFYLDLPSIL